MSAERNRRSAAGRERPGPARRSSASAFWEQAGTLLIAVLVALAIRAFVIEPFRIPSGSMLPTLLIGDHLFVNKFVYGIKVPFSDLRLPGLREPARGDVIVFTVAKHGPETFPADLRPDLPREEFVKRIMGLPGDHIQLREDGVYVNGERLASRPLEEVFRDDLGRELAVRRISLDGRSFRVLDDPRMGFRGAASFHVEPGRYFVLGDNRDHSKDSRVWGTVRKAEIKGPAFVLYWSWDFNGSWGELLNPATLWELFTDKMRWERIGDSVE